MNRIWLFAFLFLSLAIRVEATHQRAAEIIYTHLGGLTYEITIIMYTYTPSPADDMRTTLPIHWGDNTVDDIPRIVFQDLPDNYTLNVYRMNHTFPGTGSYVISVEDPNRNYGVVNIPNSVNVPMYVESLLVINPYLGYNNSVQLLNPPIDQGCVGKLFVHNASAYDPDGDSLSYRLVVCRGADGLEIPGYTFPMASEEFYLDPVSGDLVWQNPVLQGEYNVAFVIDEWRNGTKIGSVMRDMQILIGACNNNPPVINAPDQVCTIAGRSPITFGVSATDPDHNAVVLTASGGPFEQTDDPAVLDPDPATGTPTAHATFFWSSQCSHVRKNPYSVLFKARDVHPEVSLTTLHTTSILVAAPAVENLSAEALGIGIDLQWDRYDCQNAVGFYIYRMIGNSGFIPDSCQTGVPDGLGFQRIASIADIQSVSYRDDNQGIGLVAGVEYCYVITAFFADGAESIVSNEACSSLKRDLPILTHVSNDSLDLAGGHVIVVWAKPVELDTVQYPGPYQYELYRLLPQNDQSALVYTGIGLNDTLYTDDAIQLNELSQSVRYQILLKSLAVGDIGVSKAASSVFLSVEPTDKALILHWEAQVPWHNDSTEIFRYNTTTQKFEYIATALSDTYRDEDLENDRLYRYYVVTWGSLGPGFVFPIVNYSQLAEAVPIDNIPPCPPEILVETNCETIENTIILTQIYDSCAYDVREYQIFYTPMAGVDFIHAGTIRQGETSYTHSSIDFVTACYYVIAIDSAGNISEPSNMFCVDYDVCPVIEFPNVFTPNADQINDLFVPMGYPKINPKANVERVDMVIVNRWGNVVFQTDNPVIEWDGKNQRTGLDCSEGTYFYVCDVYFQAFDRQVTQRLQGSVMILR